MRLAAAELAGGEIGVRHLMFRISGVDVGKVDGGSPQRGAASSHEQPEAGALQFLSDGFTDKLTDAGSRHQEVVPYLS
ncbi:hypothetical protein BN77_p11504 [Rhizobium mesoamericanum STM3625]|uniref:Uncharacterized protein n=1 Tax=Rhizobium mesoamericanum STM3625 TaxID=1211777 RepID=K0Q5R7_9HYPH|nr:hypothetical protein BN77_p11504 [Rhizobium mesoamericanum STM3625]